MQIRLYDCTAPKPEADELLSALRVASVEGLVPLGDILRQQVIPAAAAAMLERKRREREEAI